MPIGKLIIIATPIGNLEDISFRAINTLKISDYILCEDTRVSKKLLDHYKITTPTISYHHHSGRIKVNKILDYLSSGKTLSLISDAGTPSISDPGGQLVSEIRKKIANQSIIEVMPGPSALTSALSVSGFKADRFLFLGFLPHKKGRKTMLQEIIDSKYTVVLFESKHRIQKLLLEMDSLKINDIFVAREISKLYESYYYGSPKEILKELQDKQSNLKGEFVVVVNK